MLVLKLISCAQNVPVNQEGQRYRHYPCDKLKSADFLEYNEVGKVYTHTFLKLALEIFFRADYTGKVDTEKSFTCLDLAKIFKLLSPVLKDTSEEAIRENIYSLVNYQSDMGWDFSKYVTKKWTVDGYLYSLNEEGIKKFCGKYYSPHLVLNIEEDPQSGSANQEGQRYRQYPCSTSIETVKNDQFDTDQGKKTGSRARLIRTLETIFCADSTGRVDTEMEFTCDDLVIVYKALNPIQNRPHKRLNVNIHEMLNKKRKVGSGEWHLIDYFNIERKNNSKVFTLNEKGIAKYCGKYFDPDMLLIVEKESSAGSRKRLHSDLESDYSDEEESIDADMDRVLNLIANYCCDNERDWFKLGDIVDLDAIDSATQNQIVWGKLRGLVAEGTLYKAGNVYLLSQRIAAELNGPSSGSKSDEETSRDEGANRSGVDSLLAAAEKIDAIEDSLSE